MLNLTEDDIKALRKATVKVLKDKDFVFFAGISQTTIDKKLFTEAIKQYAPETGYKTVVDKVGTEDETIYFIKGDAVAKINVNRTDPALDKLTVTFHSTNPLAETALEVMNNSANLVSGDFMHSWRSVYVNLSMTMQSINKLCKGLDDVQVDLDVWTGFKH